MRTTLCLLALLLLPARAQETFIRHVHDPKTDTHVEVLALFSEPPRSGFLPVRVKIANNLADNRTARLHFESTAGYGRLSAKSSFGFAAPAGRTVIHDIMVPVCSGTRIHADYQNLSVNLTGSLGEASHTASNRSQHTMPAVLLSEALFTPNASLLDAEVAKKSGASRGSSAFAAKFDPKQLPADWLAFAGYDSILMTDGDWSAAPAGARNAILAWVRLGGQLAVYSSSAVTPAMLGIPQDPGFGSFVIEDISPELKLKPAATVDLVANRNPVGIRAAATHSEFDGKWPLQQHFGAEAFNYGIFILVLVLFGILVGPVNLFVFAKSGKRHRLFVTTPLISLAASLLLVALIIFRDGFGGSGMRRILMEIRPDGGQNAACIHQEQISRTGILTRARFDVDPACLMLPVAIAKSRWARFTADYDTGGSFNLQPSATRMTATGDWWQSRSEHGHSLSAVLPTRGRIEQTGTPGTLVSTFDFPVETIYLLDESRQWHRAGNIATGKPFALTPVAASEVEPILAREAAAFTTRNRHMFERAKNRPGHFIALTGSAPGIDTHPGIRWKETRTVITGPVMNH